LCADNRTFLDFFQEPIFFLTPQGAVTKANSAGRRLLGNRLDLLGCLASPSEDFRNWLRRCSGTTAPLLGSFAINRSDGAARRLQARGARLPGPTDPVQIVVRCADRETDQFSLLKKQIAQLNSQARERLHRQAVLEEALRTNETLLRELNHRVKNNIQIMVGMFSAAMRETDSQEVKEVLESANNRLVAVGAAQDLMYRTQEMTTVPTAPFIDALVKAISTSFGEGVRMEVSSADGKLSNEAAFPLALILNELLTNAAKHGRVGGQSKIRVALERHGEDFALIVHDSGPGIAEAAPSRNSSGLGLVRGLCRQIGGQLLVENDNGARIAVKFTDSQAQEEEK
jgi:two-component sensor histidine kinase